MTSPVPIGLIEDGEYRYAYWDVWSEDRRQAMFIGMHPTLKVVDDRTVRKARGIARAWGFGGLRVGHLFALKDCERSELGYGLRDPFGALNDVWLKRMAAGVDFVVACWGYSAVTSGADTYLRALLPEADLRCMGRAARGYPLALSSRELDIDPNPVPLF